MAGRTGFHYEPLATTTAFRLIELLPGKPNDRIRCRLINSDLQTAPQYSALSYEWDLVPGSAIVEVDGHLMLVRSNLVAFLEIIRSKLRLPAVIWADSICIDQGNVAERGHQVQLMRKIFTNATEIKSWLGPSTLGINHAITFCNDKPWQNSPCGLYPDEDNKYLEDKDLIKAWARAHQTALRMEPEGGGRLWWPAFSPGSPRTSASSTLHFPWFSDRDHRAALPPGDIQTVLGQLCDGVSSLCSFTYWSRLWIMPEILLGKTVLLHCGLLTINLEVLYQALGFLNRYETLRTLGILELAAASLPSNSDPERTRRQSHQDFVNCFLREQDVRRGVQRGWSVTLPELLREFGSRRCLHDRDRIYALLGIVAAQDETLPIDVDYTATAAQVFMSTADYCIRNFEWTARDCEVLHNSLGLGPQDCLASLLDGSGSRMSEPIYHQRFLRLNLFELANIASQVRCGPLARCKLQSRSGSLLVNTPVEVGDSVFMLRFLDSVVVCRDDHTAGNPRSRYLTLPSVVAWGTRFDEDDPNPSETVSLWQHHALDNRLVVGGDIADEEYGLYLMSSLFDLLVLASFPRSRRSGRRYRDTTQIDFRSHDFLQFGQMSDLGFRSRHRLLGWWKENIAHS